MKGDHSIAWLEARDAGSGCDHDTGGFVTVDSGRIEQVVLDLFKVGVADAASLDPHEEFTPPDGGRGNLFDAHYTLPAIDRGVHGRGYDA
jgi:hypothetical protein